MKTYDDALKYLDWLCVFGIKEGLERIKALTAKLGEPQNFYRTIHVAGTNGKGSVCAMLAEMLKASGLKVGLFTSPHLESYCERIRILGKQGKREVRKENSNSLIPYLPNSLIPESDFAEMIFRVKACGGTPTNFETLTAAAFLYFKEQAVDVAVIEVGLGGLYDSTNIIMPELSIITNVALDHENILGDLDGIARNKAGIIKPNVPCVTGATSKPLEIIRIVAREKNSPLYEVSEPANVGVNLRGEYQRFNAAIAIKAAEVLRLDDSAIKRGLVQVEWAGRFEIFDTTSGVVVIDGAHNPDGAAALRTSLDKTFPHGRRVWLFGVLKDKDFVTMIKILFRADDFVIVTEPKSKRASSTETICAALRERGIECVAIKNNLAAVEQLITSGGDVKIIAGSLYLIGAVRRFVEGKRI